MDGQHQADRYRLELVGVSGAGRPRPLTGVAREDRVEGAVEKLALEKSMQDAVFNKHGQMRDAMLNLADRLTATIAAGRALGAIRLLKAAEILRSIGEQ
jgi:hypothetical protein